MAHVSWGHHLNIHKHFVDLCKRGLPLDAIFHLPVCVTEKIDGSNLGIHIRRSVADGDNNGSAFELVALLGRNSILWAPDPTAGRAEIPNTKYGSAGALESLPKSMLRFASNVAMDLHVNELIVYGEAFRHETQRKASWHPFGYKVPYNALTVPLVAEGSDDSRGGSASENDDEENGSWSKFPLTSTVHQLFTKHQTPTLPASMFSTPDAYLCELKTASLGAEPIVCPPLMLFSGGTFAEAIDALHALMMKPAARCFEGCFVVVEPLSCGFKWKTAHHEEQKGIPTADELMEMGNAGFDAKKAIAENYCEGEDETQNRKMAGLRDSLRKGFGFQEVDSVRLYNKLYDVFKARPTFTDEPKGPKAVKAKAPPAALKPLEADVVAAVERELSKMTDNIEAEPKKTRTRFVDAMVPRVIAEVHLVFEESGLACPYTDAELAATAKTKTIAAIMQIAFSPAA